MGLRERIWTAAHCPYASGGWCVSWSPACDRRGDVGFRRAALDGISTPADRGPSQVYSASTAPGSVDQNWFDLCALSTNLAARLPICGSPSPTAATTGVSTAAAEMRVRFTVTCLFPSTCV